MNRKHSNDPDPAAGHQATTVSLTVVPSRAEADLIVGLLLSNGLRAAASADDAGGQDPQLQMQGVRVLVAAADEASARQVLAEAESGEVAGPNPGGQ